MSKQDFKQYVMSKKDNWQYVMSKKDKKKYVISNQDYYYILRGISRAESLNLQS